VIKSLAELLENLKQNPRYPRNPERRKADFVLAVTSARRRSIASVVKLKIERFMHHDLRHQNHPEWRRYSESVQVARSDPVRIRRVAATVLTKWRLTCDSDKGFH
jgi:hypothetical protein